MQQLLVNGLYPIVGAEEMDVFFISEGGTLICKYYTEDLCHKLSKITGKHESEALSYLPQRSQ